MSTNNAERSADAVFEAVHEVMHLYRVLQVRLLRDSPRELSHMEFKVLGYFARHPGATLSELVEYSGRDKAQIARLIATLRKHELLDAEPDAHDRRITRLRLSAAGAALHAGLRERSQALAQAAVGGLDDDERAQLVALLARVRAGLTGVG